MSVSGISAYAEYGIQSNFTTALALGAATRAWGMDQEITNFRINENLTRLGDLNTALVQKYAYGKFMGELGLEFALSDPWIIDTVLGAAVTTGAGPFTHTYEDSKTVRAITAEVGIDTTTNRVIRLSRGTTRDLTLSLNLDDVVRARWNGIFGATQGTAETTLDSSVATDSLTTPYTLVNATVESPSDTILAEVQSAELVLNPNITQNYMFTTASANRGFAVSTKKGQLSITGRFVLSIVDNAWWDKVRARTEPSDNTLRFKFTNNDTSPATDERTFQITITGLGLGEHVTNPPKYDLVTEEIPFEGRDMTAVAVNNTATPP